MNKKFTLIELLVVVAIIGILLSILLPSLQKARGVSLSAVCLSNTKQLGVAYTMYSDEYKDQTLPLLLDEGLSWIGMLYPFHNSTELIQCPSTVRADKESSHRGTSTVQWGGNNAWQVYAGHNTSASYTLNAWSYSNTGDDRQYHRYIAGMENPSNTAMLADGTWVDAWVASGNSNPLSIDGSDKTNLGRVLLDRHVGLKSNVALFDGSARAVRINKLLHLDWKANSTYRDIPLPVN